MMSTIKRSMFPSAIVQASLALATGASSSQGQELKAEGAMEPDKTYVDRIDHGPGNPRNGEGAFVTLKDGRILHAYGKYYGAGVANPIGECDDNLLSRIDARVSSDNGVTWTDDMILLQNEADLNTRDPSLLRLQDGRIALFYMRNNGLDDAQIFMRTSSDETRTWSEPVRVTQAPGAFYCVHDRVIQLKNGRIVAPCAFYRNTRKPESITDWGSYDERALVIFYLSDDGGKTWREAADWLALPKHPYIEERNYTLQEAMSLFTNRLLSPLPFGFGLQEPVVVELTTGQLWALARTTTGRQFEFFSDDNGEHWTLPQPSWFCSPFSPLSMKRLSTGDLLAIWNDHDRQQWGHLPYPTPGLVSLRTPLATAISSDEGKTWKHRRLLEAEPYNPAKVLCYTAIHQVGDHVLLSYFDGVQPERKFTQGYCVRRLPLAWFYEEEIIPK